VSWSGAASEETGWPRLPIGEGSMRGFITSMQPKVLPVPILPTALDAAPGVDLMAPPPAQGTSVIYRRRRQEAAPWQGRDGELCQ
jgi:hypothetical protein